MSTSLPGAPHADGSHEFSPSEPEHATRSRVHRCLARTAKVPCRLPENSCSEPDQTCLPSQRELNRSEPPLRSTKPLKLGEVLADMASGQHGDGAEGRILAVLQIPFLNLQQMSVAGDLLGNVSLVEALPACLREVLHRQLRIDLRLGLRRVFMDLVGERAQHIAQSFLLRDLETGEALDVLSGCFLQSELAGINGACPCRQGLGDLLKLAVPAAPGLSPGEGRCE